MNELEIKKRLKSLQSSIETATGESYEDLTGAIKVALDYANIVNIIQEGINNNGRTGGNFGFFTAFRNTSITDVSMFDFSNWQMMSSAFLNTKIKELSIDLSKITRIDMMCSQCSKLKKVIIKNMSAKTTEVSGVFYSCTNLETVEGALDFSGASRYYSSLANYPFFGCWALKEIRFVENCLSHNLPIDASPLLSDESIQSIIDGLATVTTAQTLTLYRDVKAKLTEEQIATITNKNWTLA